MKEIIAITGIFLAINSAVALVNVEELETIGALMWYEKECNNTTKEVGGIIATKLKSYGLDEDPEFNDDISNGMNQAWLAGCERIKSKALELGYSKYLICTKSDFMDSDGFMVSGCTRY